MMPSLFTHAQSVSSSHFRNTHPRSSLPLCRPEPLDSLSHTNVVRLKLVQAHANSNGCEVEPPPEELAQLRPGLLRDVVDDDGLEADVRVEEGYAAEDGVHSRVHGARGEGGDGEGHEAGSQKTLSQPVVGALGRVGLGDRGGVVDCENRRLVFRGIPLVIDTCVVLRCIMIKSYLHLECVLQGRVVSHNIFPRHRK